MKVAVVFVLLFATVLCRPARKVSVSSSDSSEEVVRRPAAPALRKQALVAPKSRPSPVKKVVAAPAAQSDESTETSEEDQGVAPVKDAVKFKAISADPNPPTESPSVISKDNDDDDDDDADDDEGTEETDEDEDESNDSSDSESGESSTPAPGTLSPAIVTAEPVPETTVDTILPSIVTDTDSGRGDSLGGYPGDYKSIMYVEEKSYHKVPVPYKSYEIVGAEKKLGYDMTDVNEVEKLPKVYKVQAFQIQSDILEEDTSTPEVESQGLDVSSGTSQDQDINPRQASLPEEESTAGESESSSTPEEEEEESASTTAESDDEESQSSEEATATPGASDSDEDDSVESDSDEEAVGPDVTTDMPAVVTAK
ncbi:osteopontin isoform X1 [Kryptolebias marmoratus]|uniref:Secreted phosphoprotein 1 n=1 Tax=Kryptolebias marmoratus TaxID=37003 RepID=A0A3Q3AQ08_KRYMA|nr:osteopontin isoform X1 [Kryptolebias marmoratus]